VTAIIPTELPLDEQRRFAAVDRAIDAMRGTGFELAPEPLLGMAHAIETFVEDGQVPTAGDEAPPEPT
jgi:hypothetical protein